MAIAISGSGTVTGISVGGLPDGVVDAGTLATNSVDSAELIDGSVDASHLASGVGGGVWTLIGTSVASTDATVTQTGINTTYETYAIVFSDITLSVDGNHIYFRCGDSSGIDSGASDYAWHMVKTATGSPTTFSAYGDTADAQLRIGGDVGNDTGEGMSGIMYVSPSDGSGKPMFYGNFVTQTTGGLPVGGSIYGARNAVITLTQVQLVAQSGTIATGRMSVFGIKHT